MRCEDDHSALFRNFGDLLFGIIYLSACIICAFEIVRRIKRRQQTRNILPVWEMDTKTPAEKSGGKQPSDTTQDRAPLASACDILQPLSHSSPLPPSGYLAAVLGEGRSKKTAGQSYQHEHERKQPTSSSGSSPEDPAPVTVQTGCKPPSGSESSTTQSDDSSQATSPPTRRTAEAGDWEYPSSSGPAETRSVQKRSQEVQFLHDVDEHGVRTWRRWVIEYS